MFLTFAGSFIVFSCLTRTLLESGEEQPLFQITSTQPLDFVEYDKLMHEPDRSGELRTTKDLSRTDPFSWTVTNEDIDGFRVVRYNVVQLRCNIIKDVLLLPNCAEMTKKCAVPPFTKSTCTAELSAPPTQHLLPVHVLTDEC